MWVGSAPTGTVQVVSSHGSSTGTVTNARCLFLLNCSPDSHREGLGVIPWAVVEIKGCVGRQWTHWHCASDVQPWNKHGDGQELKMSLSAELLQIVIGKGWV